MGDGTRTKSGFIVGRRCDACGSRMNTITFDDGNKCTLKCSQCDREYDYFLKRTTEGHDRAWIHFAESLG